MELFLETLQELFNQSIFLYKTTLSVRKKTSNLLLSFLPISFLLILNACSAKNTNLKTDLKVKNFRFNLPYQIFNTDPQLTRGTASNYALFNLHRGLVYYNKADQVTYWGAEKCFFSDDFLQLTCKLADRKFHDGSLVKSEHYINSIKTMFLAKNREIEYLKHIHGFQSYMNTKSGKAYLGIEAPDDKHLVFKFKNRDSLFLEKLTHLVFSPRKKAVHYKKKDTNYYTGPYILEELNSTSMKLTNNVHYDDTLRPNVTAFFIDDAQAALNMYEANEIDFLRFLATQEIGNYQKSPLLFKSYLSRLDGIVLSKEKLKDVNLRKALTYSLNFNILKKIYTSDSDPGCPPLPDDYFFNNRPPCFKYDPKKAKKHYKLVTVKPRKIKIFIPKVESNDHIKMAEWAQASWKKTLGINIDIEQLETGVLREQTKRNNVSIYRKGFNLQQLGCLSSLMNFHSKSPSNFIKMSSNEFDTFLSNKEKGFITKPDCSKGFKMILNEYLWIPTGRLYFAHLHSTNYKGYTINSVNQFDLANLKIKNEL